MPRRPSPLPQLFPLQNTTYEKVDQPVQDGGSPSGLEEADQQVLAATPPERAEADIARMDRHQRGVQPTGRRLRGHETGARDRGHPRQPGDVDYDRGYHNAQEGIQPNPGAERHRLPTPTGRHQHGIDPGSGAYLGGAKTCGKYCWR